MKISAVSTRNFSPSFRAKIIDGHAHLGRFNNKDYPLWSLDKFVKSPIEVVVDGKVSTDTIEKMVISSCYVLSGEEELSGNQRLLRMIEGRPEYIPIAVCQPNKTKGNTEQIQKLFKNNPGRFKGLKLHPKTLPLDNSAEFMNSYLPYMKFAQEHKLPCTFHCEGGQADAWNIYNLAQKTPEVPVILAHAGALEGDSRTNRENAIKVFEDSLKTKKANIHLDLSWVDWGKDGLPQKSQPDIKRILEIAKANDGLDKIIFGTDAPLGCFGEWEHSQMNNKKCYSNSVSFLKSTIKEVFGAEAESVSNKIFYENSEKLYSAKKFPVTKVAKYLAIAVAVIGAVVGLGKIINNKKERRT